MSSSTPPPTPPGSHLGTDFVHQLATCLRDDERIEGYWLEAGDTSIQWPPYQPLDLHFAVPEPFVDGVRHELRAVMESINAVTEFSQQEAPLKGFAGSAKLSDGTPLTYRIERTSQIGKVPRRAVNVLLDRSGGQLMPGLSYES
ncbi:MAG: hypothetical protein P8N09_01325 [Planctomycetota bacterium]|nr:hypothetical protein [Planctomycetota bacterium]